MPPEDRNDLAGHANTQATFVGLGFEGWSRVHGRRGMMGAYAVVASMHHDATTSFTNAAPLRGLLDGGRTWNAPIYDAPGVRQRG